MNFDSYYRNGWGLHPETIKYIYNILKYKNINNILEFGSGSSTKFLIDAKASLNKNYKIDSIDHSEKYAYNGYKDENLSLMIRNLITCSDEDYNGMFMKKIFNKNAFSAAEDIFNTRIKNATYNIETNDLKSNYELVIIDGPSGNGRNFSYFYIENKLKKGNNIIIDDYFHYDFVEKCSLFFNFNILDEKKFAQDHPNKGHIILEIL